MLVLFPSGPGYAQECDAEFQVEWDAALHAGLRCALYHPEALDNGSDSGICSVDIGSECVLRGWMMPEEQYRRLSHALDSQGAQLVVPPESYTEAHYLPFAYPLLYPETPESLWMTGDSEDAAWTLYQGFKSGDAIIKDWVKSAKVRWREACFIRAESDRSAFGRIFRAFRHARGNRFNRGVVLRRFVRLATRGEDMRGFPLVDEYRLFFWHGQLLAMPEVAGAESVRAELDRWTSIAHRFSSAFLSLDVAKQEDDSWIVIEAGDGGVSGLPLSIPPDAFYQRLAERT